MTLNVPPNIIGDIASATSNSFEALIPFLILLVSVPLAFYVIRRIQGLFPRH